MLELRTYQREAIDALYAWWGDGGGNALIDLATGAGKSLVAATLCKELLERWPSLRIGVVTHSRELIGQNAKELLGLWPQAPVGIYSAGLNRREARAQILFGGIQTVWNKVERIGDIDLLIIDECHLLPRSADTMYGRFIAACRGHVPDMRVVGLSATPYRLDSGRLDEGDGALFERTVYTYGIADGVRDGYLAPLISKATGARISTEGVAVRGGEYVASSLQEAMLASGILPAAVAEMVRRGQDRQAWLAFCCGVRDAELVRDEVRKHGITCEMITGDTPSTERDSIIERYKRGDIRALSNCQVLTTGFNAPRVDLIAWMRPTLSKSLYIQAMGRGTRKAAGKENCLVLDFAGNVRRHGPVDMVDGSKKPDKAGGKKEAQAPVKECPVCESYVPASALRCQDCDHEFPRSEQPKIQAVPDDSVPVMAMMEPQLVAVDGMDVSIHNAHRDDKLPTLAIAYRCGLIHHREWLCFDHDGFARQKAASTWMVLGGKTPAPASVGDAYVRRGELDTPVEILVRPDGKFWRIVSHRWTSSAPRKRA